MAKNKVMETASAPKIYIVDDDPASRKLLSFHLAKLGHRDIISFNDGFSMLNRLNDQPQIIFLDHNMEDLNGFEVLKKIKRFDPNIFVVMFSGQSKISTAVDALKYGAFDYIIKGEDALDRVSNVMIRIRMIMEKLEQAKPTIWKKIAGFI